MAVFIAAGLLGGRVGVDRAEPRPTAVPDRFGSSGVWDTGCSRCVFAVAAVELHKPNQVAQTRSRGPN